MTPWLLRVVEDSRYKVEGKEKEKDVLEKKTLAEALNTTSYQVAFCIYHNDEHFVW